MTMEVCGKLKKKHINGTMKTVKRFKREQFFEDILRESLTSFRSREETNITLWEQQMRAKEWKRMIFEDCFIENCPIMCSLRVEIISLYYASVIHLGYSFGAFWMILITEIITWEEMVWIWSNSSSLFKIMLFRMPKTKLSQVWGTQSSYSRALPRAMDMFFSSFLSTGDWKWINRSTMQ